MAKRQKQQIEKSLSSEVKVKMDLFSALGEAKRTIADVKHELLLKDKEIDGLQQQLRAFTNVLAMGGVTNDSNKSGSSGGGGGNGGLGAVGRSLGVNLNGVNGDSGSGSGLG